jgi:hypothetical protein
MNQNSKQADYEACMSYVKTNKKYPIETGEIYKDTPYDEKHASMICVDLVNKRHCDSKMRVLKYIMIALTIIVIAYIVAAYFNNYKVLSMNVPDVISSDTSSASFSLGS